ncbi:hypothetical protein BE1S18E01_35390 [Acinetobacter sp. BEC1-S18-ESBL-01]|jgi:hypothetical protein|uniref:EpsG family protein n=1 Tax=Acinetobacter TaxID=469 RepID=UPI00044D631A|nr:MULTISPECIES: EpsG family protein [Acinetobacter]EXR39770.1 putative membrane protein [Acinetobacter sp. 1294243]MCU4471221.1 EpsG family protein [Acinetobacter pittii]MCU4485931.1 EpsG family protein [Acinetobacter pittii]MDA3494352.1 EpsG family protein [Acinetobacter sp. AOR33_HL]MDH0180833.1 EpsG family protein [Acinetobacter pittii]
MYAELRYDIRNAIFYLASVMIFIIAFFLIGFSPVLGFIYCLITLSLGIGKTLVIRSLYSLGAVFSCAVMAASKNYATYNPSDDFSNNYWPVYQDLVHSKSFFDNVFADNYEYFLGFYLKTLTYINGAPFNQTQLMFVICFSVLVLFYIWLETLGLKRIPSDKKSFCVAMSIGLFQFLITLQYVRQIFALIFLLYAITFLLDKKKRQTLVFFILACFSHTTSIILFPLYVLIMKKGKRFTINVAILGGIMAILFFGIVNFLSALSFGAEFFYKLSYYLQVGDRANSLAGFKFLIPSLILSCFFFAKNEYLESWKAFQINGAILFSALFFIPELPLRLFGLLIMVLPGYLLFLSSYRIGNFFRIILILYFVFYGYRLVIRDYISLSGTEGDFMGLWYSYPWIGDHLFYYMRSLL